MIGDSNETLTSVKGVYVGHKTLDEAATGCTVVLVPPNTRASMVVRGGGPGGREFQLLEPERSVPFVNALLLTGGSAFGLAAADGVVQWLERRGIGHQTPWAMVPIVPAAVIYDLQVASSDVRPGPEHGFAACEAATTDPVEQGAVGAGTGATVGKWMGLERAMKGGVGSAAYRSRSGVTIAALSVVNPIGDVVDHATGEIVAGARDQSGGFAAAGRQIFEYERPTGPTFVQNTTLCVVATDANLSRVELKRVANQAHAGLSRSVRPVNTPHDGDVVFALSCGERTADAWTIGSLAAQIVSRSIVAAVRAAKGAYGFSGLADHKA